MVSAAAKKVCWGAQWKVRMQPEVSRVDHHVVHGLDEDFELPLLFLQGRFGGHAVGDVGQG